MVRSNFKENWLGYKYIVNHRTKEIHSVKDITSKCRIASLTRAEYITRCGMKKYLAMGYNGCSKCFKDKDNG